MIRAWPTLLGLILGYALIRLGLGHGANAEEGWHLATRWTARAGFPLLIVAYSASSLARLWPGKATGALLRDRRWWGLGFALCHTAHLCALINYFRALGEPIPPIALYGGGAAYVLMYAMALTSFPAAQRAMGHWWKRLHSAGIHYLFAIFALSYLGKAFVPESRAIGIGYGAVAIAALGLRIAAWRRRKAARPA